MPMRALRTRSSSVLLLLLAGAAGCSGGGEAAAPAPPANFTATQSPGAFDDIQVSWIPPPGDISGYEAEGRMGDGPWESLGAIPPDAIGGTLTLDDSVPELTGFTFRIRSVRGGKTSGWVEARYLRGLRWPVSVASDHPREGIRLSWTNASVAATGVRISRHFGEGWRVMAELPATAVTWTDSAQLVAGQGVQYRIAATTADVEGLPADLWDPGYPPVAVFDLTATPEAGGVRLRWVNPPVATGGIEIHRADGLNAGYFSSLDPAVLPTTATEYLDAVPGGTWTWHVVTRYPDVPAAPWAEVRGVSSPLGAALQATLVSLPDASAVASDGQGVLGFAVGGSFYPPATGAMGVVFRGAGAPPDLALGTANGFAGRQLAFDPAGHPHAVLLRPVEGSALVRLVHVWYDGTSWTEEEIARRPLDDPSTVQFALDGDGAVHLAWSTASGPVRAEYARPQGGSWTVEDLTAALPGDARVAALDVDGLGTACVAAGSAAGPVLARRGATWTAETVPVAGYVMDVRRSPAGLDVVATQCAGPPEARVGELVVLERTAAGWSPAQPVRTIGQCLPVEALRVVRSPDGGRAAVWGSVAGWLELDLRDGDAWTDVDPGPRVYPASAAWFDAAAKLHLVVRSDGYPDYTGTAPYLRYDEP